MFTWGFCYYYFWFYFSILLLFVSDKEIFLLFMGDFNFFKSIFATLGMFIKVVLNTKMISV